MAYIPQDDPLTGYMPSRTAVLEEEEFEAREIAGHYNDDFPVEWEEELQKQEDSGAKTKLLVILTSLEGQALLLHSRFLGKLCGRIFQAGSVEAKQGKQESVVDIYDGKIEAIENRQIRFCLNKTSIQPERAFALARCLSKSINADQVLIETSISAALCGASLGEDDKAKQFSLRSSAWAQKIPKSTTFSLPNLPTGILISGVPAAILSRQQAERKAALLLVTLRSSGQPGRWDLVSLSKTLSLFIEEGLQGKANVDFEDSVDFSSAQKTLKSLWRKLPSAALFA